VTRPHVEIDYPEENNAKPNVEGQAQVTHPSEKSRTRKQQQRHDWRV
jgi:hypothetical protein